MKLKNIVPLVQALCTVEEQKYFSFIASQEDVRCVGSTNKKPTFVKVLAKKAFIDKYQKENVILVDDSAYKTSINPFYLSLYAPQYVGQPDDHFLQKSLIPYLDRLLSSNKSMHQFIRENYPPWSEASLRHDWLQNMSIWKDTMYISMNGHPEHLRRFHMFIIKGTLHRLHSTLQMNFNFIQSFTLNALE